MKQDRTINYLSEFIEKPKEQIFGFTLTYENGLIENHFVIGKKIENSQKISKLKKKYEKYKILKQNKRRYFL